MNKALIYAAICTLATTALFSAGYANAKEKDGKLPHIDGNVQFPPTRWRLVRQTIRLHVPQNSKPLTKLLINVPETVTISNDIKDIDVVYENEQKINANVSVNGKKILITFSDSVAPNTKFHIDLNNVKRPTLGNGPVYRLSAQVVGSDTEIPIGVAQFRIYQ